MVNRNRVILVCDDALQPQGMNAENVQHAMYADSLSSPSCDRKEADRLALQGHQVYRWVRSTQALGTQGTVATWRLDYVAGSADKSEDEDGTAGL